MTKFKNGDRVKLHHSDDLQSIVVHAEPDSEGRIVVKTRHTGIYRVFGESVLDPDPVTTYRNVYTDGIGHVTHVDLDESFLQGWGAEQNGRIGRFVGVTELHDAVPVAFHSRWGRGVDNTPRFTFPDRGKS